MKHQSKLSKINLYDKFNAAFVSMITPEMSDMFQINMSYQTIKNRT
jgi:hypothetical protein